MCLLFCRCETISHSFFCFFFFLMIRRPPRSTLFPYTTLFRSTHAGAHSLRVVGDVSGGLGTRLAPHELVEYELGYDRLQQRFRVETLCLYDVRRSSGLDVLDVLKCHKDVFWDT